jgi:F-type H+-transporting ATPase subunit b
MDILQTLGIHWQTLLVQAVTFLVLFLLLRRFLFAPVRSILAARAQEVKGNLDAAEQARSEANRYAEELQGRLKHIREEARAEVERAQQEGRAAAARILEQARQEAAEFMERARAQLEHDRRAAMIELRQQVVDIAVLAASRALRDGLDEQAQRQAVDRFLAELETA